MLNVIIQKYILFDLKFMYQYNTNILCRVGILMFCLTHYILCISSEKCKYVKRYLKPQVRNYSNSSLRLIRNKTFLITCTRQQFYNIKI